MHKPFTSFNSSILGLPLLLVIGFGLIGGGLTARKWFSYKGHSWQVTPYITNKTTALRVDKMSITDGTFPDIKITLVNQSTQNINSYVFVVDKLRITTDHGSVGEYLKPGDTQTESIPLGNVLSAATQDPNYKGEIKIAAVSFSGLSGEGEPSEVKRLVDSHQGIKEYINDLLPILRDSLHSARANSVNALLTAEAKAINIPTYADDIKLSVGYRSGRIGISQELNNKIKNAKAISQRSNELDIKSVEELIAYYEQLLARL